MPIQPVALLRTSVAILILAAFAATASSAASAQPEYPGKLEIIRLLHERQFDRLERIVMGPPGSGPGDRGRDLRFDAFEHSDPANRQALSDWIEARPDSPAPWLARAIYLEHLGYLARGTDIASETPRQRFREMGKYFASAIQDYREALKRAVDLDVAYAGLMSIATAMGDRAAAMDLFSSGVRSAPDSPAIHYAYLRVLQPRWGGTFEQLHTYADVLRRHYTDDPRFASLAGYEDAELAAAYRAQDAEKLALQHISKAIDAHPTVYRLRFRALILDRMGRRNEAMTDIDQAIELDHEFANSYETKVWLHWDRGQFAEAASAFERAIRLDPFDPALRLSRARFFDRLARRYDSEDKEILRQDALLQLERDIQAAAVYGGGDSYLHEFRSGHLLRHRSDNQEALAAIETAIELAPDRARLWHRYAYLLFGAKDCRAVNAATQYARLCRNDNRCELDPAFPGFMPDLMPWCADPGHDRRLRPRSEPQTAIYREMHSCRDLFESKDPRAAIKACDARARKGDAGAMYDMARIYELGVHIPAKHGVAVMYIRSAAELGLPDAQAAMGTYLLRGHGVDRDIAEGIRQIREAVDKGSLVGMVALAQAYYDGTGVAEDKQESKRLLEAAIAKGSASAARAMDRLFAPKSPRSQALSPPA